jgi:hypothetical protein
VARALPPLLPNSAAAERGGVASSISPVAMRITCTALPITSAGRFRPLGSLGTKFSNHLKVYAAHARYMDRDMSITIRRMVTRGLYPPTHTERVE